MIDCRCGAQVGAPAEAAVSECESCGGQWILDRYSRREHGEPMAYVFISPEHAAAIKRPRWTAGRPNVREVVKISYRASVPMYYPVTDPAGMYGGSRTESADCGHDHKTWEAAETCGDALARAELRLRNSAAEPATAVAGEMFSRA